MEKPRKEKEPDSKKPVKLVFEETVSNYGIPKWKQIIRDLDPDRKILKTRRGRKKIKRVLKHWCDRCGIMYATYSKLSKYCDDCKLPNTTGLKKKNELKWDEKKQEWTSS